MRQRLSIMLAPERRSANCFFPFIVLIVLFDKSATGRGCPSLPQRSFRRVWGEVLGKNVQSTLKKRNLAVTFIVVKGGGGGFPVGRNESKISFEYFMPSSEAPAAIFFTPSPQRYIFSPFFKFPSQDRRTAHWLCPTDYFCCHHHHHH